MNKRKIMVPIVSLFVMFLLVNMASAYDWGHYKFKDTSDHSDMYSSGKYNGAYGANAWMTNSKPTDSLETGSLVMNKYATYQRWYYEMNAAVLPWAFGSKPGFTAVKVENFDVVLKVYDETTGQYLDGGNFFLSNGNMVFSVRREGGSSLPSMLTDLIGDYGVSGSSVLAKIFSASVEGHNSFNDGSEKGYIWYSGTPLNYFPDKIFLTFKADLNPNTFAENHKFRFEYTVYTQVSGAGWTNFNHYKQFSFNHYIDNTGWEDPEPIGCPPLCPF